MAAHEQVERDADIRRALADLEERVRRRRRLPGEPAGDEPRGEVRAVADNWFVSAHLPITWETPVIGRALALAKRATRLLLRWYVNPIVDQQNEFNAAVARAFVRVEAQQEALAQAVSEMERRLAALDVAGSQSPVASRQSPVVSEESPARNEAAGAGKPTSEMGGQATDTAGKTAGRRRARRRPGGEAEEPQP